MASGPSSGPTSRRSDAALPPTASASSGAAGRRRRRRPSASARMASSSAASTGSARRWRSVSEPEPTAKERDHADAAGAVPTAISVEPPPTSTTADRAGGRPRPASGWRPGRRAAPPRRPSSTCDLDAAARAQRSQQLVAVVGGADGGRGDHAHGPAPAARAAASWAVDHPRDLVDLRRRGCAPSARSSRPMRVNERCCTTSRTPAGRRLGHENAGGVRPDVDAGAQHGGARKVAMMGPMTGDAAIVVDGLRKAYGEHEAVRGISFTSAGARSSGCSGPTARARRRPSRSSRATASARAATSSVLGMDPGDRPAALRERVGIVLQSSGLYRHLTVREAVAHWAGLYPAPRDVDETIALTGLEASADVRTRRAVGRPAAPAGLRARARSATPSWSSSTSRPRASTPRRGARRGRRCAPCRRSARPCCSPRTTSTRRRRWPTASRSSRTARCSPRARRASSAPARAATA